MKRPMTLAAGIVATVLNALYVVLTMFSISIIIAALTSVAGGETAAVATYVAIVTLISLAVVVVTLVLNAVAITGYKCDAEKYRRKRGVIIAAIVFNMILTVLLIVGMAGGAVGWLDILLLIGSVAASVLYIVDLCLEKKRVAAPVVENK